MKESILMAKYDSRASFYGKAKVKDNEHGEISLYSYGSKVCTISDGKYRLNKAIDEDLLFSHTTLRHIKEFLHQYLGIEHTTKSELKKAL